MRNLLFLAALSISGSITGCMWSEFDDLADTTWVRSVDEPNVGSRDYGVAIIGVTTATSGGTVGVISDDTPDFSTIAYAADGTATIGTNDVKLGQHRIAVLTDPPLFTTDGMGKIALAERSTTGGNIAVVFGSATAPAGIEFAAAAPPDAVTFSGADIVVAAGNTFYTLQTSAQVPCASSDTAFKAAGITADTMNLWVWSQAGVLQNYPNGTLVPCGGGMLPAPGSTFTTTGFMPAVGARIHLVGNYAILTGTAASSRMGQVFVVDRTTMTQVDMMSVDGLKSSTVATFGGKTYLVLGVPDRAVDGVVSGEVDLLELDTTTGMLTKTPAQSLHDAQPDSGEFFGRSVTTTKFNDKDILVIAAKSEVFAYYKTALYDALP